MRPLGIRTFIDLRSPREVQSYPESPLERAGLLHINVPIVTDVTMGVGSPADDYPILLRTAGENCREVFCHLARDRYPVAISCFAGKDRTSLTSALILGALGVSGDLIVADDTLSERHMARLPAIHRGLNAGAPEEGPLPAWLAATPATMETMLQAIVDEWGSVGCYLASIGVTTQEVRNIRAALVG